MATRPHRIEDGFRGRVLTDQQRAELVSAFLGSVDSDEAVVIETQTNFPFADQPRLETPSIGTNLGVVLRNAPIIPVRKNRKERRAEQREQEEVHVESGRVILAFRRENSVAGFILRDLQPGERDKALVYFESERAEKYPWCRCAKRGCVGVHRDTEVHFSPILVASSQGKRFTFSVVGLNNRLYGANLCVKWVRPVTVFEPAKE